MHYFSLKFGFHISICLAIMHATCHVVFAEFICPTPEVFNNELLSDRSPQDVVVDGVSYRVWNEAGGNDLFKPLKSFREMKINPLIHSFDVHCFYDMENSSIAIARPTNLSKELIRLTIKAYYTKNPVYNSEQLKFMKILGNDLINKTTNNDIIIFVGRSLILVPIYWNFINLGREYSLISFSGGSGYYKMSAQKFELPRWSILQCYKKYLEKTDLYRRLEDNPSARLVLIDYTESGGSIASFTMILKALFPEFMQRAIHIIGVVPEGKDLPYMEGRLKDLNATFEFNKVGAGLAYIFKTWSYSFPGLSHFSEEEWCTSFDPDTAEISGGIDIVIKQAEEEWAAN